MSFLLYFLLGCLSEIFRTYHGLSPEIFSKISSIAPLWDFCWNFAYIPALSFRGFSVVVSRVFFSVIILWFPDITLRVLPGIPNRNYAGICIIFLYFFFFLLISFCIFIIIAPIKRDFPNNLRTYLKITYETPSKKLPENNAEQPFGKISRGTLEEILSKIAVSQKKTI